MMLAVSRPSRWVLAVGTRGPCHNRTAAYDPDIKGETNRFEVDETRGELA